MNLKVVSINIPMSDVLKVLAHFGTGKSMPILFLNISPGACNKVRMMLKMTNSERDLLPLSLLDFISFSPESIFLGYVRDQLIFLPRKNETRQPTPSFLLL